LSNFCVALYFCLARQVIRDYQDKSSDEIMEWLKTYLDFARPIFVDHEQFVSNDADLVMDGTLSLNEKLNLALKTIPSKKDLLKYNTKVRQN